MAGNPFEDAEKAFRRAMDEHVRGMREDIERARDQMHSAVERARADMEAAKADFEEQMERARDGFRLDPNWGSNFQRRKGRKDRKPPSGEPAPVTPRPNPTPLTGGAEAPIE